MKYALTDLLPGIALERADREAKAKAELEEFSFEHFSRMGASGNVREFLAERLHNIADDITAGRDPYTVIYSDTAAIISRSVAELTGPLYTSQEVKWNQERLAKLEARLDAIHAEHGEVGSPLECFLETLQFSGETQVSGATLTAHGFDVKRIPHYLRALAQSRVSTDA